MNKQKSSRAASQQRSFGGGCRRSGRWQGRRNPRKKKEENDFPFAVAVTDVYEGPLDLLLDLIRKQDIDIYDIPIAKITAQYLAYVEKIRELDVNVAADLFIWPPC